MALPLCVLAACSTSPRGGGYYDDDGPHDRIPADLANIADAIPRDEPLAKSGNRPYEVFGIRYEPVANIVGYRERGVASWYGKKFHGRRTSSGEPYDMYQMTAAHKTLPLPSYVRVRNLENGRAVVVRVNDRGPFLHGRLIDLSYAAAHKLGIVGRGTGIVEVEHADTETAVVTPFTPPSDAAAEIQAIPANPPRLSIQVGAFAQADNATRLRARLERAGFGPVLVQPITAPTRRYRVRIGAITDVEHGDRLVAELARQGIADALLIVE